MKTATPTTPPRNSRRWALGDRGVRAEGHHHVLDEDAAPRMQVGVVGADEGADHQGGEGPHQARRQQGGQHQGRAHLVAHRLVVDGGQVGVDLGREVEPVGMAHHREDQDGHQGHEHVLGAAAPQAEHAAHLALVGGAGGAVVGLGALPGHGAVEQSDHADQEVGEVEVGHVAGVEGIDLRMSRRRFGDSTSPTSPQPTSSSR